MMGVVVAGMIAFQSILMHDPVGLLAFGCAAHVENQRLLHAHQLRRRSASAASAAAAAAHHISVLTSSFPVACIRRPVGPHPRRVLPVSQAEEVPLPLSHLSFLCNQDHCNPPAPREFREAQMA